MINNHKNSPLLIKKIGHFWMAPQIVAFLRKAEAIVIPDCSICNVLCCSSLACVRIGNFVNPVRGVQMASGLRIVSPEHSEGSLMSPSVWLLLGSCWLRMVALSLLFWELYSPKLDYFSPGWKKMFKWSLKLSPVQYVFPSYLESFAVLLEDARIRVRQNM